MLGRDSQRGALQQGNRSFFIDSSWSLAALGGTHLFQVEKHVLFIFIVVLLALEVICLWEIHQSFMCYWTGHLGCGLGCGQGCVT